MKAPSMGRRVPPSNDVRAAELVAHEAVAAPRLPEHYHRAKATIAARLRERHIQPIDTASVRVLMYHGIVEHKKDDWLERNFHTIEQFRTHLRMMRRTLIVSPSEVMEAAESRPKRLTVAITFDDGYKNNELAAELMHAARLPWGIYVSTGQVGEPSTIWTSRLGLFLLHGNPFESRLHALGQWWDLSDRKNRLASFQGIRRPAKQLEVTDRRALMDELIAQYPEGEEDRLLSAFASFRMLDWADLRRLSAGSVVVGSHGVDHEIHNAQQSAETLEYEISHSKMAIEENLRTLCDSLAYPNGDATALSCELAQAAGYRTAFTTVDGPANRSANQYLIPRVSAPGNATSFARALLAGHASGM